MRKIVIGGLLAVVAVAVLGAGGWWFFVREDDELATSAPEIPSDLVNASPTADPPGTPSSSGSSQAYVIIPDRSEAAYFADEQLASLPLPSKAKGATNDITGTFYLTEDGLGLDPEQVSSFTVDLTTLTSNESRRDNRVQNDALQTSQFPTATFTASSVTGHDPSIPEGEAQTLMLTGILDLHGVQKEVTWEVQALREGDVITALATLKDIPFSDFNITPPNVAGFVSVEDDVTLQVQIVAQRS